MLQWNIYVTVMRPTIDVATVESMHYILPHSNIKELKFMITIGSELSWNLGQRQMMPSFIIMSFNIME